MNRLDIWLIVWCSLTLTVFAGVGGYLYGHNKAYKEGLASAEEAWNTGFDACMYSKKLHEFVRQGSSL